MKFIDKQFLLNSRSTFLQEKKLLSVLSGIKERLAKNPIVNTIKRRGEAYVREQARNAIYQSIQDIKAKKEALLFPIYSRHLGKTPNEIKTIINDYPTTIPAFPSGQMYIESDTVDTSTDAGKREINPLFLSAVQDYKTNLRLFQERQKLVDAIEGLHSFHPEVKSMSDKHDKLIKSLEESLEKVDPIVQVPSKQDPSKMIDMRKTSHLIALSKNK